jgi:hypothetical protein
MGFEAGPAATIPARERFYADTRASATRQRTLEANGIDCGAGPLSERSGYAARGTVRARLSAQASLARIVRSQHTLIRDAAIAFRILASGSPLECPE